MLLTTSTLIHAEDDDSDFNETKQLLHVTGASTSIGAENICDPEVSCKLWVPTNFMVQKTYNITMHSHCCLTARLAMVG